MNVGGDIRCFGQRLGGGNWRFAIRDPFVGEAAPPMGIVELPRQGR